MPYSNMPKAMWPKMEKCVADVKAKSKGVVNAYAVCHDSIMGKGKGGGKKKAAKEMPDGNFVLDMELAFALGYKDESFDDMSSAIRNAWNAQHPSSDAKQPESSDSGYVQDVYPSRVIVRKDGKDYEYMYTEDIDGNVTFGDPVEVEKTYMPMSANSEIGFGGIKAYEDSAGGKYIVLWTSNAFEDKEKEIFSTKAWEKYIDRRDESGVQDRVWFWHLKGTDFATIVWQDVVGRFLLEVAKVDDTKYGNKMFEAICHPERFPDLLPQGWGTSHGYMYRIGDKQGGVYDFVEKFETTVLPAHRSCNVYGGVKTAKEVLMATKNKKEKADGLASLIGDEDAQAILRDAEAETDRLERKGVKHKEAPVEAEEEVETEAEEEVETEAEEEVEASAPKDDSAVYELELDDTVVAEIATKVAASKEFEASIVRVVKAALAKSVKELKSSILAEAVAAAKEATEDSVDDHKERIVKQVLSGKVKLRPYVASKAKESVVDEEDVDLGDGEKDDDGKDSQIRQLPGGDIVHNVVTSFMSGH
jgi:hypothetical protein